MATSEEIRLIIKAATDQAVSAVERLNKKVDDSEKKTKNFGKTTEALKNNWIKLTAVAVGAGIAIKKAFDFAKEASEYRQSTEAMSMQFGISADMMIAKLKEVSAGTISNKNLVLSANRAMALNVSKDQNQIATLLEYARLRARAMGIETTQAFNDIVTGIGRASPLILDNLGIITKGWAEEAQAAGKAYDAQFILNKVLRDAKIALGETGDLVLTEAERFQQMEASAENARVAIGQALTPAITTLSDIITGALQWFNGLNESMRNSITYAGLGAVAFAVLTKVVMAFGITLSAAIWPVTLIAAAVAGAIAIFVYWEDVIYGLEVAWNSVRFTIDYAWTSIKIFYNWVIANFGNIIDIVAMPWIEAINIIIRGINLVSDANIKLINRTVMFDEEGAKRRMEIEKERLAQLEIEDVAAKEAEVVRQQEQNKKIESSKRISGQKIGKNHQKEITTFLYREKERYNQALRLNEDYFKQRAEMMGLDTQKYGEWSSFMMNNLDKSSKKQFKIWKAFAIQKATIDTYMAAMAAYNAMAGIPYVGPVLGAVAAASTVALGMQNIAKIAATKYEGAEHGALIKGMAGEGALINVGERRKDEMIVPLEDDEATDRLRGTFGGGGININIEHFYGDDDSLPEKFVEKIDAALYERRRRGESRL